MKITQLYIYPIKSLRALPLPTATVTGTGFHHDRRFMLLRVLSDPSKAKKPLASAPSTASNGTTILENMHVSLYPEMTRFTTALRIGPAAKTYPLHGEIVVTFHPVDEGSQMQTRTLEIPIRPDVQALGLDHVNVVMHSSPTRAYDMGKVYNEWFSACFGYEVVLAYLGPHSRPILGNVSPYPAMSDSHEESLYNKAVKSVWSYVPSLSWGSSTAGKQAAIEGDENEKREDGYDGFSNPRDLGRITFTDCASYLIVTEESLSEASARLPEGEKMDITKFRPNVVVSGSDGAWDEDFWAEVDIFPSAPAHTKPEEDQKVSIVLTANCTRCQSINIDYATGKPGTGESGKMLKKLMKDRRVDKGVKYSPVFGRYGFVAGDEMVGRTVTVGDEVVVGRRNGERSVFEWPGLSN